MTHRARNTDFENSAKTTTQSRGKRSFLKKLNRYGKKLALANAVSFK